METVCKLRYKEGHAQRARVKNLTSPLRYDEGMLSVPEEFLQQVRQALKNLGDKQNLMVKFIGYTDDVPLTGRDERIYGDPVGLSKARARRVALAVQDALGLPTAAIDSDGRGASQPLASNDTQQGRALNRRVEVEFWYDDPLQELPDEPQLCPDDAGDEMVTKVYDPPSGGIDPIVRRRQADHSAPATPNVCAASWTTSATGPTSPAVHRLHQNERLDRRTAAVYGDDIGLSAARARRAMDASASRSA